MPPTKAKPPSRARVAATADKYIAKDGAAPTGAPTRLVNLKRLALLLDRNRSTIDEWVEAGMPVVERGDRAIGKEWVIDVAQVVAWREETILARARADAAARSRPPGGAEAHDDLGYLLGDMSPKERLTLAAQVMKLAERQRFSCNTSAVEGLWTRAFRDVGNSCMSIPELCARDMGGLPEDVVARFRRTAKERIAAILGAAAAEFSKSMADMTTAPREAPPEDEEEDEAAA